MKEQRENNTAIRRDLTVGALISLGLTLTARLLNVIYTEISSSSSVFVGILDNVVFVFDSVIFAAGAALILHFILRGNRRCVGLSFLFVLLILALDYTASFVIDLITGNLIVGLELASALYLLLNFAARALTYFLLFLFAPFITGRTEMSNHRVPSLSLKRPEGRLILAAALLHMLPYLIFEIYSNILGIVEYGLPDMTDIVPILSAYGEVILIDGALTYFAVFLIMTVLSLSVKKTDET